MPTGIGTAIVGGVAASAGGAAINSLTGAGESQGQGAYAPPSSWETALNKQQEARLNEMYKNPDTRDQLTDLFKSQLTQFLTKNASGAVTPEQVQQASAFIDQTFTNPAQNVLNQNLADYQAQAQGRAAALGRSPTADIATQQAIAGEGMRQNLGLQAERGSRIQTETNDQFKRGLMGLDAGMQGSNFLNNLGQQAFTNRISLMKGLSGIQDRLQRDRGIQGYTTSPGLMGNLSSGMSGVNSLVSGGQKLGGMLGGLGSSAAPSSPNTFNNFGVGNTGNFSL